MTETSPAEEIFFAALAIESPPERAAYLKQASAGDAALRRRVERMLAAHPKVGGFLELSTADNPPGETVGMVLAGRYTLTEKIGEGGMGEVWVARQTEPVKRKVAVKLIKAGMDSKAVLARFEVERQALAMMDHPNISKVLDGGLTPDGRPFFVMELVKGTPITEYCDERKLTPRERLELFIPVCQAIQHAHTKGVIHRDIKPTNVLVALYDDHPVPKVIDFGVAKATNQPLTEQPLETAFGSVVGTPQYMSPEQATFNNLDIDTRADVYSLGVLLYELLTGTTPLNRNRLNQVAFPEILRMIRDEEPQKPSTRLNDSKDTLPSISAQRQTEPAKLTKLVRGELDWIVMKALEKDRSRRYDTANGFAADVQRYLSDEPVQACPPSVGYRLRKFVRRNKGPVFAGMMLVGLLVLGTVGTSIGMIWARSAEQKATLYATAERDQRVIAESQRDRALAAEKRAGVEAEIAKAVSAFFREDLLAEAAPERNAREKKVTVEELLHRAAAKIDKKFKDQPRVEAAIRQTMGDAFRRLGDFKSSLHHQQRALELRRQELGEDAPESLLTLNNLALTYLANGQYDKAELHLIDAVRLTRRVKGEEHKDTLASLKNLAQVYQMLNQPARAEPIYVEVLEASRRLFGDADRLTLSTMNNLAVLYKNQGNAKAVYD